MEIFRQYDNQFRALRIWRSYKEDLKNATYKNQRKALAILRNCISADSLDLNLDMLLGKPLHFAGNDAPSLNEIDEDCNGSYSNARRVLEEDR